MFVLKCPECGTKTSLALTQSVYEGPFRCWKCRGTFVVTIHGEELKSYESITEEEFEKYLEDTHSP
jgi:hypothetical protein